MLRLRTEDHVSMFLKPSKASELIDDENLSDKEDRDDIDEDEAKHIPTQLMEMLDAEDGDSENGSGEESEIDEDATNLDLLDQNNHSIRTEQVNVSALNSSFL